VNVREFGHSARRKKALKRNHSLTKKFGEIALVAGDKTAAKCNVYASQRFERPQLRGKPDERCRRGNAVERHVDKRGDSACGRRTRRCLETFPIASSRIVDMYMRIDEARQNAKPARVKNRDTGRQRLPNLDNGLDLTACNVHITRQLATLRDNSLTTNDGFDAHMESAL
jgi:hypothetical protein